MNPQEELDNWGKITMLIENDWGEKGTGFLIKYKFSYGGFPRIKIFLVTCKHVLSKEPERINQIEEITIYPLVKQIGGSLQRQQTQLPLRNKENSKNWRIHPDSNIDLVVIDASELYFENTNFENDAPSQQYFINDEYMDQLKISVGDNIVVFGFPDIEQNKNSEPILRTGTISTPIDKEIEFKILSKTEKLKAFIIDGETIPGSSGSPVILYPTIGRTIGDRNYFGLSVPPILLGILVETTYAKVEYQYFSGWTYSGLGIAINANAILETIKMFEQ